MPESAVKNPISDGFATAPVHDVSEIEDTIAKLGHEPGGGLIVPPEAFTITHHKLIIASTARHRLPAIYDDVQNVSHN